MGSLLLLGVGGKAFSGSAPLDGLSGLTAAWSISRQLLTSYAGAFYTESSGEITAVNDQSGNSRNLGLVAGGDEPQLSAGGPNSRACADCNGTNEAFRYNAAISNLITNAAGYIIASVLIDAITTNAANMWTNDAVFSDGGSFIGFHLKNGGGATYTGHGYNFDTTSDSTSHASFPVGSVAVIEWRHDAGNILSRVNMGTWQTVASGNTGTMTGTFVIMQGAGGTAFTEGLFFEMAAFNAVPDDPTRDAIAANFMSWVGA